jgi:hypothetical protein
LNEPVVRLALPEDREGLIGHCHMIHQENGLFSLSERRLNALLDRYFDKQGAIVGVIGDQGEPESSIYLSIESSYYSEDLHLMELWNFVMPPRESKGGHAKRLIEFAKHCSDSLRLPLMIGILSNQRVAAKERLYERQLERAGAFFVHNKEFAGHTAWSEH